MGQAIYFSPLNPLRLSVLWKTMGQAIYFSPLNPLRLSVLSEAGVRTTDRKLLF